MEKSNAYCEDSIIKIKNAKLEISDLLENTFRVEINSKYSALTSINAKKQTYYFGKPELNPIRERVTGIYKGKPFEINHYFDNVLVFRASEADFIEFKSILRFISQEIISEKPVCSVATIDNSKRISNFSRKNILMIWDSTNPEITMASAISGNGGCYWLNENEKILKIKTHNGRKLCTYNNSANQMPLIAEERCM